MRLFCPLLVLVLALFVSGCVTDRGIILDTDSPVHFASRAMAGVAFDPFSVDLDVFSVATGDGTATVQFTTDGELDGEPRTFGPAKWWAAFEGVEKIKSDDEAKIAAALDFLFGSEVPDRFKPPAPEPEASSSAGGGAGVSPGG